MFNYLDFDTSIEIICFLISVICLSKDRSWVWKYFSLYLFITCTAELTAIFLRSHHHPNGWPYNILMFFEMFFTSLIFSRLFNKYIKSKSLILIGFALFLITYIFETISNSHKKMKPAILYFNNSTNTLMSVIFVFYALYYFYLLLKDSNYVDLRFSSDFWWVIGVLFFYFGSTAVNIYRGIEESASKQNLCYYILNILIIMLYSCWSYSFICRKWQTTTSIT